MIHEILILIETVALFSQGFSFRRRYLSMMVVSSLILLFVTGLAIIWKGIDIYFNTLSNASIYDAVVSIIYVLFWFVSGYIVGGYRRITNEKMKDILVLSISIFGLIFTLVVLSILLSGEKL